MSQTAELERTIRCAPPDALKLKPCSLFDRCMRSRRHHPWQLCLLFPPFPSRPPRSFPPLALLSLSSAPSPPALRAGAYGGVVTHSRPLSIIALPSQAPPGPGDLTFQDAETARSQEFLKHERRLLDAARHVEEAEERAEVYLRERPCLCGRHQSHPQHDLLPIHDQT